MAIARNVVVLGQAPMIMRLLLRLLLLLFVSASSVDAGEGRKVVASDNVDASTASVPADQKETIIPSSAQQQQQQQQQQLPPPWSPATSDHASVQDLFQEYNTIFRYGNRNAASHRWATFLIQRSSQMISEQRLELFFSGFCAVSGSPIRPSNYNRYRLTLPLVTTTAAAAKAAAIENQSNDDDGSDGEEQSQCDLAPNSEQPQTRMATGYMHYCCWPCVCDTQDFIRVDTLNVTLKDGLVVQKHFAVIGNPCDRPDALREPFVQPFARYSKRPTTLEETAKEVRCSPQGQLEGATLSDHGYIIIGMFFDAVETSHDELNELMSPLLGPPQPGRVTTTTTATTATTTEMVSSTENTVMFQDEREYVHECSNRAMNGYNSGMGEIFRRVSAISPIAIDHHHPNHDEICGRQSR